MALVANPFGTDIRSEDVLDNLSFFDDWEERYKYIIDLGKQLPAMPESKPKSFYCMAVKAKYGLIAKFKMAKLFWKPTLMRILCAAY